MTALLADPFVFMALTCDALLLYALVAFHPPCRHCWPKCSQKGTAASRTWRKAADGLRGQGAGATRCQVSIVNCEVCVCCICACMLRGWVIALAVAGCGTGTSRMQGPVSTALGCFHGCGKCRQVCSCLLSSYAFYRLVGSASEALLLSLLCMLMVVKESLLWLCKFCRGDRHSPLRGWNFAGWIHILYS